MGKVPNMRLLGILAAVLPSLMLVACGGDVDDLTAYIDEVKSRPGGRIEPLPQIKPYETYQYAVGQARSPFMPDTPQVVDQGPAGGPTPVKNRNKEYLEQFPLDTLSMVGTLERQGKTFGLIQTKDGLVHRVLPGNYLGQNEGRIVAVRDAEIEVEELVANGIGSFFKRTAAIGLN
jgi:type IV pilus assembly protein PilP